MISFTSSLLKLSLVCLICSLLNSLQVNVAWAETPEAIKEKLRLEIASNSANELPIIIQFGAMNSLEERFQKGSINLQVYQTAMATQHTALMSKLNRRNRPKGLRTFAATSHMAMHANVDELEILLEDKTIRVFSDEPYDLMLAQSSARVYPTQNISEFHGNNQWTVAVIDTGIDKNHPFLADRVVSEACYSSNTISSTSLCPNGVTSSTANGSGLPCDISDSCNHGTQVAGIIAGNADDFDGIARQAQLISIKVGSSQIDPDSCAGGLTPCYGTTASEILAALDRVYSLRNTFDIAAVNLSLATQTRFSGQCDDVRPETEIINRLTQARIAVVTAVGTSSDAGNLPSPACITNTISVASTFDTSDAPDVRNNTSEELDLFAPGINIETSTPGGGFVNTIGTSYAAPHVAAAMVVLREAAAPNVSVAQLVDLLKSVGPIVSQNSIDRRRLDISAALMDVAFIVPDSIKVIPAILMLLLNED